MTNERRTAIVRTGAIFNTIINLKFDTMKTLVNEIIVKGAVILPTQAKDTYKPIEGNSFKKVQDANTLEIIAYYVDGERVDFDSYDFIETLNRIRGKRFSCAKTTQDPKTGNYLHYHSAN